MTSFWTNTVWYVALAVSCIATVLFTLVKSRKRMKTIAFFFAVLGMTYIIEIFLLVVFDAYAYHPKIASDSFHESLIGNFFSQYSVSASAVLLAALGLSIWWRLGFAISYFLIDVLFVALNIYTHNWYNSWYTLAGFFLYSWVVKAWYAKVFTWPSKIVYYVTLFLSLFSLSGNILGTTLNFMEIRRLSFGLYEQITKDNTASGILHSIILNIIIILVYKIQFRPVVKGLLFLLLFSADFILYRLGFIQVKEGWFMISELIGLLGSYAFTVFLDRSLGPFQAKQIKSKN
jgi:hypothetical protein